MLTIFKKLQQRFGEFIICYLKNLNFNAICGSNEALVVIDENMEHWVL
jgi:hypothetical protein